MKLADLKALVGQAKTIQAGNQANPNIANYAGAVIVVTGMIITKGIPIAGLGGTKLDKVTFNLLPGTGPEPLPGAPEINALDSFHEAAVNNAEELIPVLGETFPAPMQFRIVEKVSLKREKNIFYCEFIGLYDDPQNPLSLQDLLEDDPEEEEGLDPNGEYPDEENA